MNCKNCLKYFNCKEADDDCICLLEFAPDNLPDPQKWIDYNRLIIGDTTER